MKFHGNEQKKGTLKIQKSQIAILVLNQSPISAVFPIVRFAGNSKTALTGDLLYFLYFQVHVESDQKINGAYAMALHFTGELLTCP